MKSNFIFIIGTVGILMTGCQHSKHKKDEVISQRYIHKYGYDVSQEEWERADYPGQVITTLRNGVTITATYEDNVLNGPTTFTFPHSQTLESSNIYEKGNLIKKLSYNIRGIPVQEEIYLSPTHIKTTKWYLDGTPMCIEERSFDELIEARYYNAKNEMVYQLANGSGTRVVRDDSGSITTKETINNGYPSLRETFHANGTPHTILSLRNGILHGRKQVFAQSGEPVSVEHWDMNKLHGLATYFQNGCRYLEIQFTQGLKNGLERHYIDGETIVEESQWLRNQKHGPTTVYYDGMSKTEWYYNNDRVSKDKFRELCDREQMISIMNERGKQGYFQ